MNPWLLPVVVCKTFVGRKNTQLLKTGSRREIILSLEMWECSKKACGPSCEVWDVHFTWNILKNWH